MFLEIFPLAITFPRFVRIQNTRLTILYWSMVLLTLTALIYSFMVSEGYYLEKTPRGGVQFWPTRWKVPAERIGALNADDDNKDHCVAPEKYEFCDSSDCSWSARDMQCIDLCTRGSSEECMEPIERFTKMESSIFFPTFYSEINTIRSSGLRQDPDTKWRIVKGVQDLGIGFQHEYVVESPASLFSERTQQKGDSRLVEDGLLTVLEDVDGNELRRWDPGETIELTLKQIIEAGKISFDSIYLDEETKIGRNFLEGAHIPDGILMRLAGADITLELDYRNKKTSRTSDWPGHVCYLRIHFVPAWTSNVNVQVMDHLGSVSFRYYQGVRIRFRTSGTLAWISFEQISNKLTSVLVFIGVVKQLMFFFTLNCLGVVSKIYKGFIFETARIGKEACGMAARLAGYTSSFLALRDRPKGISKDRLFERFKRTFLHTQELDYTEIQRFVDFVFVRMAKDSDTDSVIDVEEFSDACSYGEALHFETLVQLFDADRKKGLLERTFAGPTMRNLFKTDQKLHRRRTLDHSESKVFERQRSIHLDSSQPPDPTASTDSAATFDSGMISDELVAQIQKEIKRILAADDCEATDGSNIEKLGDRPLSLSGINPIFSGSSGSIEPLFKLEKDSNLKNWQRNQVAHPSTEEFRRVAKARSEPDSTCDDSICDERSVCNPFSSRKKRGHPCCYTHN